MAYLDDVFVIAPNMEIAQNRLHRLYNSLLKYRMEVNINKSRFFHLMPEGEIGTDEVLFVQGNTPQQQQQQQQQDIERSESASSSDPQPYAIECCSHLKVLGSLITLDQRERDEFFQIAAQKAIKIMCAASQLHLQQFLMISRLCVVSRLVHLVRTLPVSAPILKAFDMTAENVHKQAREISSDLLRLEVEAFEKAAAKQSGSEGSVQQ